MLLKHELTLWVAGECFRPADTSSSFLEATKALFPFTAAQSTQVSSYHTTPGALEPAQEDTSASGVPG
jgi:hypothetical protein